MINNQKISEKIYLSLYITSLVLVASYMIATNQYAGELDSFELNVTLTEIVSLLGLSIFGFIAAYFFYIVTKNRRLYFSITPWRVDSKRFANVFFALVIVQLVFLIVTDVGRFGSQATSSYSPIFALLNVDSLFAIFYFVTREKKAVSKYYFFSIVFIYVLFKILQGWSGVILLILFFELHFYFKKRKIKIWPRSILILFLPLLLIASGGKVYQYVFPYKFEIRGLSISEINYTEGVVNLTNRLTFFPISVGAYERSYDVKLNAHNDEISFREARGFFRPFTPRFLMENKEFRSINNLIKQAFYPYIEATTSTDIGFIMYSVLVFSTDMNDGIILLMMTIILLLINKFIYDSFEEYRGQLDFLYFLLIMKLYYTGSPEMVFSYGSIGIIFLLPLLIGLAAIKQK